MLAGALVALGAGVPLLPSPAVADTGSGTLSGRVVDARAVAAGDPAAPALPGAQVRVEPSGAATLSGTAGGFTLVAPAGPVTVVVSAPGFGAYRLQGLLIGPGRHPTLRVGLDRAPVSDVVPAGPAPVGAARPPAPRAAAATASRVTIVKRTYGPSCSGYSSTATPPTTIRVLTYGQHDASGWGTAPTGVRTVAFADYVRSVLPNEWYSSWRPESLRAGAVAVKGYAWYWVTHFGGTFDDGSGTHPPVCFDVTDDIAFQRYVPGVTDPATDDAVTATWPIAAVRAGSLLETGYQATLTGSSGEACGAGAGSADVMSQWGSQTCAGAGRDYTQILGTYYRGASPAGALTAYWNRLGGAAAVVGAPVGPEFEVPGGREQDFARGRLWWSVPGSVHEVHGAILGHYLALGGPGGVLGFPRSDELTMPDGFGRANAFVAGNLYWSPATGAHEVHGAILSAYAALSYERGLLRYPTSDELVTADRAGRVSAFQGGAVYWSVPTGAHEVHGAIRTRWAALGAERSPLGYPVSNEYPVTGGRRSDFQHGSVTWSAATGATTVVVG